MAFGLIRVRELSAREIGSADIHNARKYDELGMETPSNIKQEKSGNNHVFYGTPYDGATEGNLNDFVNKRIKEANCKVKSNSVKALEFVVGASPEFYDVYSPSGHFSNCYNWLADRYGRENIVAHYDHYDESNPHAHFIVVPIVSKEIKWKNAKGEGKKLENRLCARDLTGTKEKLSQLQTDYYEFIKDFGRNGVEFYRGTKASNQLKHYTQKTSAELGYLRSDLKQIERELYNILDKYTNNIITLRQAKELTEPIKEKSNRLQERYTEINNNIDKLTNEANEKEARRENYNQGDKWKKGQDFGIGF